jgi:hypothetical protein
MNILRLSLAVTMVAGLLNAAEPPPKLCMLLPDNPKLMYPYSDSPDGDVSDLIRPYRYCAKDPGCVAGAGRVGTVPGAPSPEEGIYVVIGHFESEKGSRYEVGHGEHQLPPNSRDYGDTAWVSMNTRYAAIRFARGPYYGEVFALGSYVPRAAGVARHIDQGLRNLPASCEEAATTPSQLKPPVDNGRPTPPQFSRMAATPMATTLPAPPAGYGWTHLCFKADPGAALLDPEAHRSWAQPQSAAALSGNLAGKLRTLYGCSQMNPERSARLFADISMAVAGRFRDASCFRGDAGVILKDRNAHLTAFRTANEFLSNLNWKLDAALRCLPREEQARFFGEVSASIAGAMER